MAFLLTPNFRASRATSYPRLVPTSFTAQAGIKASALSSLIRVSHPSEYSIPVTVPSGHTTTRPSCLHRFLVDQYLLRSF